MAFSLKFTEAANTVQVAIEIKAEQVGGVISGLTTKRAGSLITFCAQLFKVQAADVSINRPNWVVLGNMLIQMIWQTKKIGADSRCSGKVYPP